MHIFVEAHVTHLDEVGKRHALGLLRLWVGEHLDREAVVYTGDCQKDER